MNFNAQENIEKIIAFIRNYYQKNHLQGAVIGISGGKDSAVVASLFTKALGKEKVIGLWMPCHSKIDDYHDACEICKFLDIELKTFDLTKIYDDYVEQIQKNNIVSDHDLVDANINIKPRLRMSTLYYYASMISKVKKGTYLVCGTSNKSELYVGYFTKGGDNVCDISILKDFYVDEVVSMADCMHIPYHIAHKIPDDGLSNISDEEKLGFLYRDVKIVSEEEETGIKNQDLSFEVRKLIQNKHALNSHKFYVASFNREGE